MRFSTAEYELLKARLAPKQDQPPPRESDLHDAILSECRARGWLALHGGMHRKTTRTLGEPDFVILADRGKVFLVEAKSKVGKLSLPQRAVQAWARKLGHEIHVVRTVEEFMGVVRSIL